MRERHGEALFSDDGSTIDEQVAALLRGRTIAVAESCTGGLMAGRLTDLAGSSAYVLGGVVVYSNAAKTALADVPRPLIERHGAVSPEVAAALADGAIARFGAELGIGITGIAGPGGGTPEKPVGTVCLSVARAGGPREDRTVRLPGDRGLIRERTTTSRCTCSAACWREPAAVRRARPAGSGARGARVVSRRGRRRRRCGGRSTPPRSTSRSPSSATGRRRTPPRSRRCSPPAARRRDCGWPARCCCRRGARACSRVAVEDLDGALAPLQAAVSDRLAAAGLYVPEKRPFRPHVTVARLRSGARAPRAVALEPPALAFSGTAVTLYRSHLGRGGATL